MGSRIVPSDWRVPEVKTGVDSGVKIVPSDWRVPEVKTGVGSEVQNSAFRLEGPRGKDRGRQWVSV